MPFINSKISIKISKEEEITLKNRLGRAIALIPGKSESWLMVDFEDDCKLYFKGQEYEKIVFVEVKIFGDASKQALSSLTTEICNIYNEELLVDKDKIYVKYELVENWGWNGNNF
ncbi:MAG: phenylpyruvate tautomerase MIF-related protein [Velocimicrobium sp.]